MIYPSRRDVVKTVATVACALGWHRVRAESAAQFGLKIDGLLRAATNAGEVPGVVGIAEVSKEAHEVS